MSTASLIFQQSLNDLRASNASLNRTIKGAQNSAYPSQNPVKNAAGSTAGQTPASGMAGRDLAAAGCLKHKYSQKEYSEVYSLKFSPDDEYLAAALGDGTVQVYQAKTAVQIAQLRTDDAFRAPCTSVEWRPAFPGAKTKNVLIAAYADGQVLHWHATSGQRLAKVTEENNQVLGVGFQPSGARFATVGSDLRVRVYDENSGKLLVALSSGKGQMTAGHSNRVFAVKFHPMDSNIVISGGWDNMIAVWDTRLQYSVRSIYGPHVCGDALDFNESGDQVLSGSYSKDNQLQVWAFSSGDLVETVPWSVKKDRKVCFLYSAQFSHGKSSRNRFIYGAGGGTVNEFKLFSSETRRCIGMVHNVPLTVYASAMNSSEDLVAFGGGSKTVHVYDADASVALNVNVGNIGPGAGPRPGGVGENGINAGLDFAY